MSKCNRKVSVIWYSCFENYFLCFKVLTNLEIKLFFKGVGDLGPCTYHGHIVQYSFVRVHAKYFILQKFSVNKKFIPLIFLNVKASM